jgi:hypothetical protein
MAVEAGRDAPDFALSRAQALSTTMTMKAV